MTAENSTFPNMTCEFENDELFTFLSTKLFVFTGMLISVIFIPTHLFLLYVTDNVKTIKGKNFVSLMFMLLIKYLLILLNAILDIPRTTALPNIMSLLILAYVHLSATCWLGVISEHSLNIIKKNIWKSYNVRWISWSVSSIVGWILPVCLLLLAYLFALGISEQFCKSKCILNCQTGIFYITFEVIRLLLLIKISIDLIRVKYYTSFMIPCDGAEETTISDLDYINFGFMFCIIFHSSWLLEIIAYIFASKVFITVTSIASSVEAIFIVLGTLWWKKFTSSRNPS